MTRTCCATLSLAGAMWLCVGTAMAQQTAEVVIRDFRFTPAEITIEQGDSIRWTNREKRQYHSVWFEAAGEEESDYLFPEESYVKQFNEKGDFPYRCGPHPEMTGVVHVR